MRSDGGDERGLIRMLEHSGISGVYHGIFLGGRDSMSNEIEIERYDN
jgi:hypothetical protein